MTNLDHGTANAALLMASVDGTARHPDERTGVSEDTRNHTNGKLYAAMITAAYDDVEWAVAAHHILYVRKSFSLPQEIPSADTLIFDHYIAQKIWGANWRDVLTRLALEPANTRDTLLHTLFYNRPPTP